MHHSAFAGEEAFDFASAIGGETVGGLVSLATSAVAGNDETGIDDGADEGDTLVDGLSATFVRVKGKFEFLAEIFLDDADVAHELAFLGHRHNNEKIVNVATVMFVAEVDGDETVELVEENVGDELAGEVADDDAMAGLAIEKTFVGGKGCPFGFGAADDDIAHGVVVDNLLPKKLDGLVKLVAVVGATGDLVFDEIIGRESFGVDSALELAVESPANALV